jgi:hypothetical protein
MDDPHNALLVVDLVEDAVATAASRPRACELAVQGSAHPTGREEQVPGQELQGRCGHDLGQILGQ